MSRKTRKAQEKVAGSGTATISPPLDAAKDGSVPMGKTGSGIGGSVRGQPIVEGAFITPSRMSFAESPFGQRYALQKPRPFTTQDILARVQVWAFDVIGVHSYTSGITPLDWIPGITDAMIIYAQWYEMTRDLAMRSLKYKPTPTSLSTNPLILRDYFNVYYYALANLTTLLNLNRLLMYSPALGLLGRYLPQIAARMSRAWIRLQAVLAPVFLKAHAIRNGSIVYQPGFIEPTLRFWSAGYLPDSALGGPYAYSVGGTVNAMLTSSSNLASFMTGIEECIFWLERGSSTMSAGLLADYTAMKDVMAMVNDVVPGTYSQGLPPSKDLPGFTNDPGLLVDLMRRAVFRKDIKPGFTDRWTVFPAPQQSILMEKIPVVLSQKGVVGLYDCTALGAPKYGMLKPSAISFFNDVDSPWACVGTELPVGDSLDRASFDVRSTFGLPTGSVDEETYSTLLGSYNALYSAFDTDSASEIRLYALRDSLRSLHPWDDVRYVERAATPSYWPRLVQEDLGFGLAWVDPEDIGWNYGEFTAKMLAVPYSKFA